ncbi:MAG: phosphatase PAP2 family protein [Methanomassiliicoccales archaeon]|nr:phosphatase PAP2 family protein [Methanomassiliicoccales archaeon]
MTRRTWYILGALLATCILLPLLLKVGEIVDLDTWLFLEVREEYETSLKTFLRFFTELGSLTVWFIIVPLLWLGRKKEAAMTLLFALLLVIFIGFSMKFAVDRPRPYEVIAHVDPPYHLFDPSFPSGHTMVAFAGAVAVGMKWRKALPPLLVLAAAIGFSRVYLGVHYPYDVASGALLGILIGLLADSIDLHRQVIWLESRTKKLADRLGLNQKKHLS